MKTYSVCKNCITREELVSGRFGRRGQGFCERCKRAVNVSFVQLPEEEFPREEQPTLPDAGKTH